jgi:hypothetical protein
MTDPQGVCVANILPVAGIKYSIYMSVVQGRSTSYGKNYSRSFSAGSNPKPCNPAEI